MTECDFCSIKKSDLLYSDETVAVFLAKNAAAPGHTMVIPKKHFTILEQVQDSMLGALFIAANKISTILFESLGAKGTNIIVENGTAAGQKIPHFSISIIPRNEGDNIDFQWQPKKISEEQMSMAEVQLRAEALSAVPDEEPKKPKVIEERREEVIEESEEDYMIKQLRRQP